MKRVRVSPRENWQQKCEAVGFTYHTIEGKPYWSEDVVYEFTEEEVDRIDIATQELHDMCLELVADLIQYKKYEYFWFAGNQKVIDLIESSWARKDKGIYGRFDLAYTGDSIKMLEYNADTPTSLLESSIVQWDFIKDNNFPDQFNSIHEKLIERWKELLSVRGAQSVYMTTLTDAPAEDWGNINYILETCIEAGCTHATSVDLESIGYVESKRAFVDARNVEIPLIFKLYPWEWMMHDEFSAYIDNVNTVWIEPPWKMLLSNKLILPLLWNKFPNHPLLLESYHADSVEGLEKIKTGSWVRKPTLSREGNNISIYKDGVKTFESPDFEPLYDTTGYIIQKYIDIPIFEDIYKTTIGSWVIGDTSAGMGIREDKEVAGNASVFVPHYFI